MMERSEEVMPGGLSVIVRTGVVHTTLGFLLTPPRLPQEKKWPNTIHEELPIIFLHKNGNF